MRGLLTIILLPLLFEVNSDGAQFRLDLRPDNSNQQPNDILIPQKNSGWIHSGSTWANGGAWAADHFVMHAFYLEPTPGSTFPETNFNFTQTNNCYVELTWLPAPTIASYFPVKLPIANQTKRAYVLKVWVNDPGPTPVRYSYIVRCTENANRVFSEQQWGMVRRVAGSVFLNPSWHTKKDPPGFAGGKLPPLSFHGSLFYTDRKKYHRISLRRADYPLRFEISSKLDRQSGAQWKRLSGSSSWKLFPVIPPARSGRVPFK